MIKIISFFIILLLLSCKKNEESVKAQTIYYNGDILTMNDETVLVEALAVSNGIIMDIGNEEAIFKYKDDNTKVIDLEGKTLLPGFIDAHSHVANLGLQFMSANLYPPPDGNGSSVFEIIETLKEYYATNPELYKETSFLIGAGYDDASLTEKRHPTKEDLDKHFPDIPVYIIHQSGHIGVGNSKSLEVLNIDEETQNPQGGIIRKVVGGVDPNGVLEETAHFYALFNILNVTQDFSEKILKKGIDTMMSYGYTTVQEGRTEEGQIKVVEDYSKKYGLPIDLVLYPDVFMFEDGAKYASKNYENGKRYRVGGVKLSLDGSPQGKTAWRDTPYVIPPLGESNDYVGYPAVKEEAAINAIDEAFRNNVQILVHANGEAAIDLFLKGVSLANKKYGSKDVRPVLIHGQFTRHDQVLKAKELNVFPSLFPMHTFYWGDWHSKETIGEPGVNHISPTGWFLDEDEILTIHHDAPIVPPNSMMLLWTAVNRMSRTGRDIGFEEQSLSAYQALKSITDWASYQYFEEDRKGTIEKGKLADFVILSKNPLEVPPIDLYYIEVLETIKEDEVIYKKENS